MRFGVKTGQGLVGYSYDELSSIWTKSEELGFDSAWLHDHLLSYIYKRTDPCLEAYSTLAALARDTKKLHMGVMVTCVGYRNPAFLAKVGATIDAISGGRFIMGIGAGWYEEEFKSYGYRFPSVGERLGQLREAAKILRMMWTDESPSFAGKYFSIDKVTCYPKPVHGNIPIWIGINKGKKTLPKMAAQLGDGLNTTANPELCKQIIDKAEETRKSLGRSRSEVTYSSQPNLLAGSESEIERIIDHEAKAAGLSPKEFTDGLKRDNCIVGTPEKCAQELRAYLDAGMEYLIPRIVGDRMLWPLEIFKDKVAPLLRK